MAVSPADLVNPYIGTLAHLLQSTRPVVMLPHSYAQSYPIAEGNNDCYCNESVSGFPIGQISFMPSHRADTSSPEAFANTLDHARETARPYGSRLELEEGGIAVEATVTARTYCYRVSGGCAIRLSLTQVDELHVDDRSISLRRCGPDGHRLPGVEHVYLTFSAPLRVISRTAEQLVLAYDAPSVELFGAVSYVSQDNARLIYDREAKGRSFEQIWAQARATWDRQLSRVRVQGNTPDRQAAFYTALYRAFGRMVDFSEYGRYYSGYDGRVHEGPFFYTNDGLWDTFRCMHPLQLLLEPARQTQILESYNLMYRHSGLMPCFPGACGDLPVMLGFHASALFADAAAKGLDVDLQTAYEGMRKNHMTQSMLPWVCGEGLTPPDICYHEKGFFPALGPDEAESVPQAHGFERRQAVAVTLEHAYDDWCAAQVARRLGRMEDYELLMRRARNYQNVFDPGTGFMGPRGSDGAWLPHDLMWGGGQGGRAFFAENNTYTYTWSVMHDVSGLCRLMGGPQAMQRRLDELFTMPIRKCGQPASKFSYLAQFPDATGLMGQFPMGNEPAFHIPYLYNYCGAAWKAQKRLRDLMDIWFTNSPVGICGDEDGGAMSSWFVFSAMGFYPVCPGSEDYALGTPLFDRVDIALENGKTFTIEAPGAGEGSRYIKSATLDGAALERPFLRHGDIVRGGTLHLEMDARPNKAFGA